MQTESGPTATSNCTSSFQIRQGDAKSAAGSGPRAICRARLVPPFDRDAGRLVVRPAEWRPYVRADRTRPARRHFVSGTRNLVSNRWNSDTFGPAFVAFPGHSETIFALLTSAAGGRVFYAAGLFPVGRRRRFPDAGCARRSNARSFQETGAVANRVLRRRRGGLSPAAPARSAVFLYNPFDETILSKFIQDNADVLREHRIPTSSTWNSGSFARLDDAGFVLLPQAQLLPSGFDLSLRLGLRLASPASLPNLLPSISRKRIFCFGRAFVDMRGDAAFLQRVAELHAQEAGRRIARDIDVVFVHQAPHHGRMGVEQIGFDGEIVVVDDGVDALAELRDAIDDDRGCVRSRLRRASDIVPD